MKSNTLERGRSFFVPTNMIGHFGECIFASGHQMEHAFSKESSLFREKQTMTTSCEMKIIKLEIVRGDQHLAKNI